MMCCVNCLKRKIDCNTIYKNKNILGGFLND